MSGRGVFTISLDTELAWGSFDKNGIDRYGTAYLQTPAVVERLCDLFGHYDVPATWAMVAHLFDDCEGHTSRDNERAEWLDASPCSRDIDRSLWYAPEILETVKQCDTSQDIGLHGYSHLEFSHHSRLAASEELTEAVSTAQSAGLDPTSFVYPRNGIGHIDLLAEHGIEVYRGIDARWYERLSIEQLSRPFRFLDEARLRSPPTVVPVVQQGVVSVPGSQVFRPDSGPWKWTPSLSQVSRAVKGLDKASETRRIFHLWFHPFNLANRIDYHLSLLEDILEYAVTLRNEGNLEFMTLKEIGQAYHDGRWIHRPKEDQTE